jgi:phospholipase C
VWIILMENKDWDEIKDSASAPYINSLLAEGAHAEAYHNVPDASLHPSEPNYVWLEAGDALGFTDDSEPGPDNCAVGEDHLTKQLEAAGIDWRSYQEDIDGGDCPLSGVNDYAPKHNPMIFFDDVSGTDCSDDQSADCLAHVVPYTQLEADLQNGTVASYNFLTPNLCNDMHDDCGDGDIEQGDTWLSVEIPKIQASDAYQQGGAIFITWDEGGSGNQPIGMIVVSPFARVGYSNEIEYSHSSTLRTMQTIFGVGPFLNDAANAEDLGDLFTSFP